MSPSMSAAERLAEAAERARNPQVTSVHGPLTVGSTWERVRDSQRYLVRRVAWDSMARTWIITLANHDSGKPSSLRLATLERGYRPLGGVR